MRLLFCIPVFFFVFLNKLSSQMKVTENGIKIYDGTSRIFPPDWLTGKIKAKATTPADSIKIGMDTTAINTAMDKYPTGLLKSQLKYIYLVGEL